MTEREPVKPIRFEYLNHRGERGVRTLTPMRVWFGLTEWHPTSQWLLEGFDHDRSAVRNYAIADIITWLPPEPDDPQCAPPGIYRHFKGGLYQVIGTARDSESRDKMVVYRTLYGEFDLWVRPLAMFCEQVVVDGKSVPRFELLMEVGGA